MILLKEKERATRASPTFAHCVRQGAGLLLVLLLIGLPPVSSAEAERVQDDLTCEVDPGNGEPLDAGDTWEGALELSRYQTCTANMDWAKDQTGDLADWFYVQNSANEGVDPTCCTSLQLLECTHWSPPTLPPTPVLGFGHGATLLPMIFYQNFPGEPPHEPAFFSGVFGPECDLATASMFEGDNINGRWYIRLALTSIHEDTTGQADYTLTIK